MRPSTVQRPRIGPGVGEGSLRYKAEGDEETVEELSGNEGRSLVRPKMNQKTNDLFDREKPSPSPPTDRLTPET